jgi:hypothetical protein
VGNGRLELIGLRDKPIRELAAIADSFDAHALAVNPQIAPYRRADTVENILALIAVLVAENGVGKLLAVPRRAAKVHIQHRVAVRCVHLLLEVECWTILSVRPAVNHHDQGMLRRGGHADGFGEKGFHVETIVVADERKGFHLGDRLPRENFLVQVRELARRGRAGFVVKLRAITRRSEGISDRSVLPGRIRANDASLINDVFGLPARDGQAHQMIAAAFLHGEIHTASVRRPLRRTLAIVNDVAAFAAIAAVRVHKPDVRVFHGGFAIRQAAARATIRDEFAVRRPQRIVFAVLRCSQAVNAVVCKLQREKIVVEELVLIGLMTGCEENLLPVG